MLADVGSPTWDAAFQQVRRAERSAGRVQRPVTPRPRMACDAVPARRGVPGAPLAAPAAGCGALAAGICGQPGVLGCRWELWQQGGRHLRLHACHGGRAAPPLLPSRMGSSLPLQPPPTTRQPRPRPRRSPPPQADNQHSPIVSGQHNVCAGAGGCRPQCWQPRVGAGWGAGIGATIYTCSVRLQWAQRPCNRPWSAWPGCCKWTRAQACWSSSCRWAAALGMALPAPGRTRRLANRT